MRHRVHGRKLGRTTAHRKALFRNQLTALFTHERIVTTVPKAKELRPIAERMVTLARTGTLPARRKVLTMVPDRDVVRRLFDEIAPRFMERPGGYTRIVRLGNRRGDGAELALIEFVDYTPPERGESAGAEGKQSLMDRARGMFGGRRGEEDAAEDAVEAVGTAEEETPATEDAREPAGPAGDVRESADAATEEAPEAEEESEEKSE